MKINRLIPIMLLLTITLMGCKKDGNAGDGLSKDEMNFTAGSSPNTKTVYDKNNPWQINWIEGDQITVFCEQAGNKKQAAYDVTPIAATPHKGTITLALSESPDGTKERRTGLRWREGKHNVYSVYPSLGQSGGNITKTGEGKFTFNFPQTQYCSKDGVTPVGGNYMLNPNMYLAYMVAKNEGLDPLSFVELLFKPIATTLEITVRGEAQLPGDANFVELNSLELKVKNLAGQYVKKSGTNYQVQFDAKQTYTTPTTAVSDALTPYTSGAVATADFSIKITGGAAFQLKPKESVTFTVFLPPIKNLDDVEVKCMGSGNIELGKKQILTNVQYARPASKRRITLPNVVVAPDSIKVLPANDINLATRPYTSGDIVLKYGLTQQLKAIAYYPNGTKDITSDAGTAWSSNLTSISSVNTTDNKGLVTLINVGTSKITATYRGVSGTANIKPQIYKALTIDDYYQWDAYEHYEPTNWQNAPWQLGSPGYNPNLTPAEQSCAGAPSRQEVQTYLGNGVNYSLTDGLIFTLGPDGTSGNKLYCNGLWLKKWGSAGWDNSASAGTVRYTPADHGRPADSDIGKYFFLPTCGGYSLISGRFQFAGVRGRYWSSTPGTTNPDNAFCLGFNSDYANVYSRYDSLNTRNYRSIGFVPMVGFDDSYVPATVEEITISPDPLNIERGQTRTLRVTKVTMSDGSPLTPIPTSDFKWEITNTGVVTGSSTTNEITLTGATVGSTTVTVTYGGKSATTTVNVADIIYTPDDYYMWDAPEDQPYPTTNGGAKPNFNTTNNQATRSCANAPTFDEIQMYLAAGVYWVEDGPAYICPDGNTYRIGLMVRKAANIPNFYAGTAPKKTIADPPINGVSYESLKDDYFFLPVCGNYYSGSFNNAGANGFNWLSTPHTTNTDKAYRLYFNYSYAYVNDDGGRRLNGLVPMVGFDPTYVPATVQSITISPDPLNIEPGNSGVLTATVTMSNGSTPPTTGFTWVINSPNGVVTGSSTTNEITLTGATVGSTIVTVTYAGVSCTATVNVNSIASPLIYNGTTYNYYMWYAPINEPYNYPTMNYNTTNGPAIQSCENAPTRDEMQMYLGADVYWVTDGPAYTINGTTYHTGLWVKKKDEIPGFGTTAPKEENEITPKSGFSLLSNEEKSKYFFLPACGLYYNGKFNNRGTVGYYWSSTLESGNLPYVSSYVICLQFSSSSVGVITNGSSYGFASRNFGFIPMPKL